MTNPKRNSIVLRILSHLKCMNHQTTPTNFKMEVANKTLMMEEPSKVSTYMMTISIPVMATRIMERLKKVKKRLLSSDTGSSACPLMVCWFSVLE